MERAEREREESREQRAESRESIERNTNGLAMCFEAEM